ncbi:4Fe-4S dicluster domain-containing protein [Natroniella sulfidigena]|uniref:4Fe-4S dicluster domain-containing protein n=1 Tax=Natroniella sulfidigena TaxID=723921 RepID=UPI00200A254D|nr:4Fe-4S dicluster domain-containing protein [Natroniella sulfidigena]MCK8816094.1 4Fe-4S dicluster domain-containing protein [Natroniella sulfidigena]
MLIKKLFDLITEIDFAPIKINSSSCTKLRSPHNNCQNCIEACPQGAITIDKEVKISYSKCDNCGQCYSSCPVGVFQIQEGSDAKLITEATRIADANDKLIINCQENRLQRKEKQSAIKVNCLGRLTPGLLLEFLGLGFNYLVLKTENCIQCQQAAEELINGIITDTDSLLKAVGEENRIWFNQFEAESAPQTGIDFLSAVTVDNSNVSAEVTDRREVFSVLSSEVKKSFSKQEEQEEQLAKKVSFDRKKIINFLEQISIDKIEFNEQAQSLLWSLNISSDCSFCGSCVKLCPTSALQLKKEGEDEEEISYQQLFCTGCNLCQDICVVDAIELVKAQKINLCQEEEVLLKGSKRNCSQCEQEFITAQQGDEVKCFGCSFQERLIAANN